MISIKRMFYPESEDDTIYIINWGKAERYEQLTDSSHAPNYFKKNLSIMDYVVCIVRFKLKQL